MTHKQVTAVSNLLEAWNFLRKDLYDNGFEYSAEPSNRDIKKFIMQVKCPFSSDTIQLASILDARTPLCYVIEDNHTIRIL